MYWYYLDYIDPIIPIPGHPSRGKILREEYGAITYNNRDTCGLIPQCG